jgi:hypothetical protein
MTAKKKKSIKIDPTARVGELRAQLAALEAEQLGAQEADAREARRRTMIDELTAVRKELATLEAAQRAMLEADARKERRALLAKQLAETRTELRIQRPAFDKIAKEIVQKQEDLNAIHRNMMTVIEVLGRYQAAKPAVVDYLPSDPEAREWNDNVRILSTRLEKLRAEKLALGNIELLRLEGMRTRDRIQYLGWLEANITNELQNKLAQWPSGGVLAPQ